MRDLTDSYCERCGSHYIFGPSPAKGPTLAGARLLAKGLKNFVMTDGTSLDEALAAARIDDTHSVSTQVAEDFHRTFNFCMTCRQYACEKCWNENQGACLSCAPLWNQEPVAPEGHLIVRTPTVEKQPAVDMRQKADGSGDSVPWPAEDPLPAQPPVKARPVAQRPPAQQPEPVALAPLAPPEPTPATRPLAQPPRPVEPEATAPQPVPGPLAPPPARPVPAQTRPQRQSSRVTAEERAAAESLRTQSQAWKSRDDGWVLWPSGSEEEGGLTLTADELKLVEAGLGRAPAEDAAPANGLPAAPGPGAFTPSHTLDEDAARATAREPAHRSDPAIPAAGAWEPEAPSPREAPSPGFDLLGSLRGSVEFSKPATEAEDKRPAEPRRTPVIGRLLGRRDAEAEAPSKSPGPDETPAAPVRKGRAPTSPWPMPTPWTARPIDQDRRIDEAGQEAQAWSAEAPAEQIGSAFVSAEPVPDPAPLEPQAAPHAEPESRNLVAGQPEPVMAFGARSAAEEDSEPETEAAQQPLFAISASTERWPEVPREPVVTREVRPSPPVEGPAADPLAPAAWPPIGASWPAQERTAAPWPVAQPAFTPAVAARQSEPSAEIGESPLVAALWAESAQQVLEQGSVRVCHRCALPVSTHARFCRRCGTAQA